jgi:DNA polymerase III subunit delta
VADLKPAYLVHGDDDARIDAWRARLRRRAEEERGPGGLEAFDGHASTPDEVALSLAALTFDTGTRYLLVDHADAWKASELGPLEEALAGPPPDTVLVLLVRGKPLKQLVKLVESVDGEVREQAAPKPWELPRWVADRAREEGVQLEGEAAKALIAAVGGGQQRLAREIEKLALALHPGTRASVEDVERVAARDASPQAYDLADAIVAGDLRVALALAEALEAHGEPPGRLMWPIARRLREVHRAAALLEAGMPESKVAESLKAPPWLAKKTIARAKKADRAALESALCEIADLEIELRGGGEQPLEDEAAFSLALARAAAGSSQTAGLS